MVGWEDRGREAEVGWSVIAGLYLAVGLGLYDYGRVVAVCSHEALRREWNGYI